ncbi:MAG: hypothetical protein K8R57_06305 [Verrucomicrobia bacterium]|nr:hypothetical protein [Verrucomicrobiota bacterium]
MLLGNLGINLLPDQIVIPSAYQAFGPDGQLLDPKQEAAVKDLGAMLAVQVEEGIELRHLRFWSCRTTRLLWVVPWIPSLPTILFSFG